MAELSRLTSRDAVLSAIAEHDRLGREAFLKKYGFRHAREYFVEYEGRFYDSKSILGAAFGYQYPSEGPLRSSQFSGGESVVTALGRLHFPVVFSPETFLVLAENEVQADARFDKWQDVTGERYHFPNAYRNRIRPGREFVYYKGARRVGGRAEPEYFGWGRIGSVYPDPSTFDRPASQRQWLCDIEEYRPFRNTVAFRDSAGVLRETGALNEPSNYWRTGVREISRPAFAAILQAAGETLEQPTQEAAALPPISGVSPIEAVDPFELLVPIARGDATKATKRSTFAGRSSRRTKEIGDRAEQLVLHWLRSKCTSEEEGARIVWLANLGEKPGWDIEDRRRPKAPIVFEVKGTTGSRFPAFEVTINEWEAAKTHRGRYHLVLVTGCETSTPRIVVIQDPWGVAQSGKLAVTPTSFRIAAVSQ